MSKGCRDGFCFGCEERRSVGREVGLSVKGGWMMGKGQNLRSGYIFIYVK